MTQPRLTWIIPLALAVAGCGGSGEDGARAGASGATPKTVELSWAPNREAAVNAPGGGYQVHYAIRRGVAPGRPGVSTVDVPYEAGPAAPTSTRVELPPGTYYVRVSAYSALTTARGEPARSAPSPELIVVVR